jgi:tetratricopeptide (TPR) repeat protein
MDLKPTLARLFDQIARAEQEYIDSLTPAERQANGTLEAWAPKETLAHMAVWQERIAKNLTAGLHGGEPIHYENYLELNDQDCLANSQLSFDECLTKVLTGQAMLRQLFDSLSESELLRVDVLPWQESRPVWKILVGNIVDHPVSHLCMLYNARGDQEKALQLQEQTTQALLDLDSDPVWQGTARYNLACVYALSGRKEKAIQLLEESLKLNPQLIDWSQKDTDLDSLRQEPAYLALYPK